MDNEQIGMCKIATGTNISLSMIININILNTAILSKILMKMIK